MHNCRIIKVYFEILFRDETGYYTQPAPRYMKRVLDGLIGDGVEFDPDDINLWSKRNFDYSVSELLTFSDLLEEIRKQLGFTEEIYNCTNILSIRTETDVITIENYSIKIAAFLKKFDITEELFTCFIFSKYQGIIDRKDNISFYMHSNEAGKHNRPHVHVLVGKDYEASVDILTGSLLSGDLPPRYYTKVLNKIEECQQYYLDCWNNKTNGLSFDLDYGLKNRAKAKSLYHH